MASPFKDQWSVQSFLKPFKRATETLYKQNKKNDAAA